MRLVRELALSGSGSEPVVPPGLAERPGALARLILSDFRSFACADFRFEPGITVLTGPNGGGKTNILEAISLMAPGRGLRGARLGDITRRGSNNPGASWAVSAEISTRGGGMRLGTGLVRDTLGRDRRVFRIEGEKASASDVAELVRLVWLTPAMDRLLEESAGHRRRFFDRLVVTLDAGHSSRLARYERALAQRQQLLNEGKGEPGWLAGLERVMAEEGVAIAAARRETLHRLNMRIAAGGPWADEALFPRAEIELAGRIEKALDDRPAVLVETEFERALETGRARDAAAGRAIEGAHRTDLRVHHAAKRMPAEECSTGEQKALLLNIVLAQMALVAETASVAPIVLLDEIAAHLDAPRREALFAAIQGAGAQLFLTGTDEALFAPLAGRAQFLAVGEAHVSAGPQPYSHRS